MYPITINRKKVEEYVDELGLVFVENVTDLGLVYRNKRDSKIYCFRDCGFGQYRVDVYERKHEK